jgi:sulfite reductase (ferredoxin)
VVGDGDARLAQNLDRVSARDLPSFVVDVLKTWIEKKPQFHSFGEYIAAEGAAHIRALADRYRNVPEFDEDKNYFYDWGAKDVFSLVGMGVGECSAGLFDLIGVDLKQIEALSARFSAPLSEEERGEVLYGITLSASRMLLVTRGIEAPSDHAIFASFGKHFIEAGLIDASFKPLVDLAQQRDTAALREKSCEVLALADAVKALYAGMDNSLRFAAELARQPAAVPSAAAAVDADSVRDYRSVGCPTNFVKIKLDLAQLKTGDRLKVLLGDGSPIQNVPRSVASEGHKVLSQEKVGDHWAIVIEKG